MVIFTYELAQGGWSAQELGAYVNKTIVEVVDHSPQLVINAQIARIVYCAKPEQLEYDFRTIICIQVSSTILPEQEGDGK